MKSIIENVAFFIFELLVLNCDFELKQYQLLNLGFKKQNKKYKNVHFLIFLCIRYHLFKATDKIMNVHNKCIRLILIDQKFILLFYEPVPKLVKAFLS